MTLAISKALESEARAVICASTGNTSASAAAYGARAGLAVYVLIPAGKIALGKLSQAMMHQATVIQVEGNFDQALSIVKEIAAQHGVELVNSINPFRIEGQKTAAMEVCDQLGFAPTLHVLPVGGFPFRRWRWDRLPFIPARNRCARRNAAARRCRSSMGSTPSSSMSKVWRA